MKELIGCCGLNCEQCDARIATINDDDDLRRRTAEKWAALNNAPQITPDTIHCMGCRTEGVKFAFCQYMCEIRQCVRTKEFATCADCSLITTCKKLAVITEHSKEALANLKQQNHGKEE